MNQEDLAVCYCIIGHPTKAKFMAVQHSDGWMPPTLRFPPGPVDFRAQMINEGMRRKYGLRTRVLRSLIQLPKNHCMELELPAGGGNKQLKEVWVGREEYQEFRTDHKGFPATPQVLHDALRQAEDIFPLWRFSRLLHALEVAEPASPQYISPIVKLPRAARAMVAAG